MIFAFETEISIEILKFVHDTNKRLESLSIMHNPFRGRIYMIPHTGNIDRISYVVDIEPIYPRFYLLATLPIIPMLAFWGITPWIILPLIFFCTGVTYTRVFFMFFLYLGLKKAKHNPPLRYFGHIEAIRRLLPIYENVP